MTTLNQPSAEVKHREALYGMRHSVESVLTRGTYSFGLIRYGLAYEESNGKWYATADEHESDCDSFIRSRASCITRNHLEAARWIVRRVHPDLRLDVDQPVARGSSSYISECPFCGATNAETATLGPKTFAGGFKVEWNWDACDHFLCTATPDEDGPRMAFYLTDEQVVSCDRCGEYTDNLDTCVHCNADPIIDRRCGGDAE